MIRKLVAIAALSGTMALGAVGVASATTPSTPAPTSSTTHTIDCTKALARVPKINAREAKAAAWVTKAQARETTATSAGHTRIANRIERRIKFVQKLEARGTKIVARIDSACGSSTSGA